MIGTFCLIREGKDYTEVVGYTPCVSTLTVNSTGKSKIWQPESSTGYWSKERRDQCEWSERLGLCWHTSPGANPFKSLGELSRYWEEPESIKMRWETPNGPYWICGKKAYGELPQLERIVHSKTDKTCFLHLTPI